MVFSGLEISINYGYTNINFDNALIFNSKIGVGLLFNREILGITTNITPVDFFYGFKIETPNEMNLYLGPRLFANYNLQIYPDLQMGHDFWATNINLSPNALLEIPYQDDLIRTQISVSLLGLTSRTPQSRNPYFFSLNPGVIFSDMNSGFEFGSLNKFLHTTFSAEYLFGKSKIWGLGYGINYFEYFAKPEIKILNHTLNLKYNFGG
jgi:hypothetical protein